MKKWSHALLSLFIFISTSPGLGFRHLWVDELETAERARTILESGTPRVIDAAGRVSLAGGGLEIEEGTLHRYTPWAQYYAAAGGLAAGRAVEADKDKAVRMPFIIAHALTGGLISYGLNALVGAPVPLSLLTGLSFSWQTDRLVHNRTARYHALLDLFLVLGLIGIGGLREKKSWAPWLTALAIFLLPQIQTVTGSLWSLLLGLICLFVLKKDLRRVFFCAVLPGILSLLIICFLCRPEQQVTRGTLSPFSFYRSFHMRKPMYYAFYFLGLSAAGLAFLKQRRLAFQLLCVFFVTIVLSALLDRHPYSQIRYYLSMPLLFLLWPVAFGLANLSARTRRIILTALLVFSVVPELKMKRFRPYQGLRIVYHDWKNERENRRQPIHEVIDYLAANAQPGDPVLFDYTTQFANWYLPQTAIALMPDALCKTKLNEKNPVWQRPLQMPRWIVWYPDRQNKPPSPKIRSYDSRALNKDKGIYLFTSETLELSQRMCVVKTWQTNRYNNAPFELYKEASFWPVGDPLDTMILAKKCEEK